MRWASATRRNSSPRAVTPSCARPRSNTTRARFDDALEICGRAARIGRSSLSFVVEMFRRGEPDRALIGAELVYVNADPKAGVSVPWSEAFRQKLRAFEPLAPQESQERAHG